MFVLLFLKLCFILCFVSVNSICYCSKSDEDVLEGKARNSVYMRSDYYPGALVAIAGNYLSLINTKEKFNDENIRLYMHHIDMMYETCRIKMKETDDIQWKYAFDELTACYMIVEKVKELHNKIFKGGVIEPSRLAKIVECLISIAYLQPRLKLFIINILLDDSDPLYKRTYNSVMHPMYVYDEKYYDKGSGSWKMMVDE